MIIGIDVSRVNIKNKTGVENYSAKLLYWFKKLDHSPYLDGGKYHNKYMLYTPKAEDPELKKLPSNFHLKEIPFPRMWTQVRLAKELRSEELDLFFVPSHVMPFVVPKAKTIVTIHDVAFKLFPESYSLAQRKYLELTTKFAVSKADAIITISETTKKDLVRLFGADPEKIKVTYLGFDAPEFNIKSYPAGTWESIADKFGIKKSFFLYLGRIEDKKNVKKMIQTFYEVLSRGEDMQFVLAGKKASGDQSQEIDELIKKYNLGDRIIFTGYIDEVEKNFLFSKASFFLFLSKYEGFGLPVLEAFYFGVPVIASRIPVFKELFEEAALLVNEKEPKESSAEIAKLLKNKRKQEKMIEKGRELVKKFSWQRCAIETIEVFETFEK